MNNFNIGDKVRVSDKILKSAAPYQTKDFAGQIVTISYIGRYTGKFFIEEDDGAYAWDRDWFEPFEGKAITFSFIARSKEEALEVASKEIEKFFGPKDWTPDEISAAQTKVIYLASKVIAEGGDVKFIKSGKAIFCKVYKSSFQLDNQINGIATPKGQDVPNDWIGKCVAICSALHEPIPFFITNKNR